jgi:glycosyltransferase involved in cell wall biosynthesis
MSEPAVVFACQHVSCGRNRTQYRRARLLADEYRLHVVARGQVCDEIAEAAEDVTAEVDSAPMRLLYPLWIVGYVLWLRLRTDIAWVHTTHAPQALLAGWLLQRTGLGWVADIWDDPRLGNDLDDGTGLGRRLARAYNAALLGVIERVLSDADLVIVALFPTILEDYGVDPLADNVCSVTNGVDLSLTSRYAAPELVEGEGCGRPGDQVSGGEEAVEGREPFDGGVPDEVTTNRDRDGGPEESSGVEQRRPTIVYVGPVQVERGVGTLLAALRHADGQVPPLRIELVGPVDDDCRSLVRAFERAGVGARHEVEMPGRVSHEEALSRVATGDVGLCLLSADVRNYRHSYPIKLFEYMALGSAVACTRLYGTREVLTDGVDGRLVPPDSPPDLGRVLAELVGDPAARHRLARNARGTVEAYDWTTVDDRVRERLDELVV